MSRNEPEKGMQLYTSFISDSNFQVKIKTRCQNVNVYSNMFIQHLSEYFFMYVVHTYLI